MTKPKDKRKKKTDPEPQPQDDSSVESGRFDTSGLQFRKPTKASSKVVLDERFASVLTDERFQLQIQDKYGRKTKKKNKEQRKEELSAFYTVEDGEDGRNGDRMGTEKKLADSSRSSNKKDNKSSDDESEVDQPGSASRIAYLTALSRGQVDLSSSSSDEDDSSDSDSSSSDDDSENEQTGLEQSGGVLDSSKLEEEVEITEEPTRYLAVTNMDWTNVRALDVFALLSSFTATGALQRVRVFVSDFGQEKLSNLERFGPGGVWKKKPKRRAADDEEESDDENVNDDDDEDIPDGDNVESDFDQEKLRAYEASKLRYYFAVAEFISPETAEAAYKEVDGMEFEHCSADVDLRAIPEADLDSVVKNRPLRDEAITLPSNYTPPDFIVSALQQTNVVCTWDLSDRDRDRTLTMYNSGDRWNALAETEDLKAYLASDASSDDEDGSDNEKAMQLRKRLGLDSEDEGSFQKRGDDSSKSSDSDQSDMDDSESDSDQSSEAGEKMLNSHQKDDSKPDDASSEDDDGGNEKEFSFVPGSLDKKTDLTEKILSKLTGAAKDKTELTPWEVYKEKRKKKRQERRQATRAKRKEVVQEDAKEPVVSAQNKAALELLVAGEEPDDAERNFDMRQLERMEKNKEKTFRGARKRKEAQRAEGVVGSEFDVNVSDERFQAVLDGTDDRFGIDPTDSNFKKTPGMLKILKEQSHRRKTKRSRKINSEMPHSTPAPNISSDSKEQTSGAKALSVLVQSLKNKHQ